MFEGHFIGQVARIIAEQATVVADFTRMSPSFQRHVEVATSGGREVVIGKKSSPQLLIGFALLVMGMILIGINFSQGETTSLSLVNGLNQHNEDRSLISESGEYIELQLPTLGLDKNFSNSQFISYNRVLGNQGATGQTLLVSGESFGLPFRSRPSSHFGFRKDPYSGKRVFHQGVDLPQRMHSQIRAAMSGVVIFSGRAEGYGNVIVIEHAKGYSTLYGHNSRNIVKTGARVKKGDVIGYVGSTGRSTGPHVHFELRRNGQYLDPMRFLGKV
jgi:murein DD-endopeptidase MepM/ murein hydrolase activator NlpD